MNKQNLSAMPDENKIEELLGKIRPIPGKDFHKKMEQARWRTEQVQPRVVINKSSLKMATALVVLLTIAMFAVTPQGRVFAQSILKFFIRANSDTILVPTQPVTWVDIAPGAPHPTLIPQPTTTPLVAFAEACGSFPDMLCTIEQIRGKVDFTVKEPANIPTGLYFTGATGGDDSIFLRYEYENNSGGLLITEERWTGSSFETWPEVGASAVVEEVRIGSLNGEYFKGSFVQNGSAGDDFATWDPNFYMETLRWVENGIAYTLKYAFITQEPLGKDGLIAVAESMTTKPVIKQSMPATPVPTATVFVDPNLITYKIALAERQAGFKLMLPPSLPEKLSLHGGADYNRATGVASIWFTYDTVNLNGLYLNQQIVTDPDDCAICGVVVGDSNSALLLHSPKVVGTNAKLQTVQIGNSTGKYYEGVRLGSGEWEAYPDIKHLRWQDGDRAFEIIAVATGLKLEDLIAIAESLK